MENNPQTSHTTNKRHALSVFSLVMITVGSVDSIRNLPTTALFGSHLIFFFLLGALFFLIPAALISAELAATYPEQGGIYIWVKRAFGNRWGFIAIWFQWIENVMWYPTILAFVAGTIGYLINPALVTNKIFLTATILCCFWGATFINLLGMKASGRFSSLCAISGLLIPMALIIGLGAAWYFSGQPLQIQFTAQSLLPDLHQSNMWVALTGIILSFCGVEIATVHAGDVANPQRAFPRALAFSAIIIISTLILGSLSIAIVLPNAQISLVAGIMQACDAIFSLFHISWMLPVIAAMLVLGIMGSVSNWIIAPTKGLLVAAKDGNLPQHLCKENKHQAPTAILIYQAVIVSIVSLVFLLMPSVNSSYWLLTVLAAQLYMFMYLLMFAAGIVLRLREPTRESAFRVPGGTFGLVLVGLMGIVGSLATVIVGFIPPDNIQIGSLFFYESLLVTGLISMCIPPFIFLRAQRATTFTKPRAILDV
jgi:amino acid transporter